MRFSNNLCTKKSLSKIVGATWRCDTTKISNGLSETTHSQTSNAKVDVFTRKRIVFCEKKVS
jgi:hypothetical protein